MTIQTEKKINLKVGTMLIKHLSESFYKNKRAIFDELATNSRDSGATRLDIKVDEKKIVFLDNGQGMDQEEFTHFFFLARSSKNGGEVTIVNKKGKKRQVIGRYGIGKLSMSQICNKFHIVSWKDGKESYGEFDFDNLKKHQYIEDVEIKINTTNSEREGSGTEITLFDLTMDAIKEIDDIRSNVSRTLPLDDEFEIYINNDKVEPYEYKDIRKSFSVDKEVEGLGKVTGEIYIAKDNFKRKDEYGVFVKVKGRVANPESSHEIVDLASLTGAQVLARRTVALFNVDALEEAQLTNRDGFIRDNEKFRIFSRWVKTTLNKFAAKACESFLKEKREKAEEESKKESVPVIRQNLRNIATRKFKEAENEREAVEENEKTSIAKKENEAKINPNPEGEGTKKQEELEEQRKAEVKKTIDVKHKTAETLLELSGKLVTKYESLGLDKPECMIDLNESAATINRDHPLYRKSASCNWLTLHTHKAVAIALAITIAERESSDGNAPIEKLREYYEVLVRMPINSEVLEDEKNSVSVQLQEAEEELQRLLKDQKNVSG